MRNDLVNVVISFQKLTNASFLDIFQLPYPFYIDALESRIKLEEEQRKRLGISSEIQNLSNDFIF